MATTSPTLIVIAGPARGRTTPLSDSVSIGRDQQNALPIADPALSRHHCVIDRQSAGLVLRDLGSKNGVFVNGCPVGERTLADGDQIRIGDSALLVMLPGGTASVVRQPVALVDTPVHWASTVAIDVRGSRYVDAGARARGGRAADDLSALLRFSEALQDIRSSETLYDLLLSHALTALRAHSAAIVVRPAGGDSLVVVSSKAPPGSEITVSRTLAARALDGGSAVLTNDNPAMCVPLLGPTPSTAALCVNGAAGRRFSEDDLQVLAAIGTIAGLAVDRVGHLEWLAGENLRLRTDAAVEHNLIGESAPMQAVFRFIARVAATDATVLLGGESGTGKELAATAIHTNSRRAAGPFVAINCAALPEALLESELFGHERGAFTGAVAQQRGRLEMAHRGTLFLDEIGELAPPLQAKLLRVLQDQIVERVGARRGIPIDVRVIAASNRDLAQAIRDGTFREDLYYRLNVVSLTMPPLRERREDLALLSAYFVRKHAARCKRVVKGVSLEARALINTYDWPGNVRELSNAIERAVVLGSTEMIAPEDLPETLLDARPADDESSGFHGRVARQKRDILREALAESGGNVAQAARALGLQPTYLHRLIKNLQVR
jgi:transcriptional regulator with GAF, ATPase, and Fis domain